MTSEENNNIAFSCLQKVVKITDNRVQDIVMKRLCYLRRELKKHERRNTILNATQNKSKDKDKESNID